MKSFLGFLGLCAGIACADNAGYVKSLGIVTGNDGNKYMRVEHSATGGYFGAATNQLWGTFYVPWSEDELLNIYRYSDLSKSLANHSVTLDAQGGYTTDKITGGWNPVVTVWLLRSP